MALSTQIPVEEYLRTSYRPDCEYVDGEVIERNVGEKGHSEIQYRLMHILRSRRAEWGIYALHEWRMRVSETRYRIPDVVIVAGPEPDEAVLSTPPLVAVEILSPDDRMTRVHQKVREYLAFGIRYVWILDPETKEAYIHTTAGVQKVTDGFLRTETPAIEVPLSAVFD